MPKQIYLINAVFVLFISELMKRTKILVMVKASFRKANLYFRVVLILIFLIVSMAPIHPPGKIIMPSALAI